MGEVLQYGDILIFKAEEKWVSKAIAMLTDSDVSHAAMYYGEREMVEMGLSGIMVSKLAIGRGEEAYQLRLAPPLDAGPLIEAARRYVKEKTIYDLPALVLLGALLVYRHIRPSARLFHIVDDILNAAVELLDELLGRLLHGGETGMVCSQLVYQVYQDCGGQYSLQIENGILQSASGMGVRLLDLRNKSVRKSRPLRQVTLPMDEELLAQELCIALASAQGEQTPSNLADAGYLAPVVCAFTESLEKVAETAKIPLDALFVTPADLAYHTRNLDNVGEVSVERLG